MDIRRDRFTNYFEIEEEALGKNRVADHFKMEEKTIRRNKLLGTLEEKKK